MSAPVNFQKLDPERIDAAVDYAMTIARAQSVVIDGFKLDPANMRMVEIGPGPDFGPALIQASRGAAVIVADRFLSEWQEDYHPEFYRRLAAAWPGPVGQLRAAAEGGYDATSLARVAEPAENLVSVATGSIDLTYSNAVLEHVVDFGAVAREFARITRPGGYGAHQIDLRDHRNFDRPLEHLVVPETDFLTIADDSNYECGNRWRSGEFEANFVETGFSIVSQTGTMKADDAYLADIIPRLRRCRSAYRNWPASDLVDISVMFSVQRRADETSNIHAGGGKAAAELVRALKSTTLALIDREPLADLGDGLEFEFSPDRIRGPEGHMWTIEIDGLPEGDTLSGERSAALLLEDGRPLGPAHALHATIREKGRGRFSHWYRQIYFSTSDGSSPRENGRRYRLLAPKAD